MKAHKLLEYEFYDPITREPILGAERFKDAQFFDFGYISNEQILDESEAATEALFERFLRLPAQHCIFELRHRQNGKSDRYTAYEYRYTPKTKDTTIFTGIYVYQKDKPAHYFNELILGWEILTPEAQTNWRLTRSLSIFESVNPKNIKWEGEGNEQYVGALTSALACMLGRLNAQGIEREYIQPPEKLNKARAKKGKTPLVSYTTVKIAPYRAPLGHSGPRDEFTSPRYHFRRGHIRRFANGQKTWVRDCYVGKKEDGEVKHTYEVGL